MAAGPELRIGDAEREAAADHLRDNFAQGRLTQEEFSERLDAIFAAKTQSQLSAITSDLPPAAARQSVPQPVAAQTGSGRQDYRSGRRPRLGFIPVIIAALVSWLLIVDLSLRTFPWPGKAAIFLAIFALIRGFLKRLVVGGARGPRGYKCRPGPRRGRYWDV
jgi:hypothetical protein